MSIGSDTAVSSEENTTHTLRAYLRQHPDITETHVRNWCLHWLITHAGQDGRVPTIPEFDRLLHGNLSDEFEGIAVDVFGGELEYSLQRGFRDLSEWVSKLGRRI